MSETVRLPVGFFTAEGGLFRYEEFDADPVAHYDEDEAREPEPPAGSLHLKQDLYEVEGEQPYVVHSVLEQRDRKRTVVGRLERFSSLAEVMVHYPSLARSAGYMIRTSDDPGSRLTGTPIALGPISHAGDEGGAADA